MSGRICDLESTPQTRGLALLLGIVLFLICAVLVKVAVSYAVASASTGPAHCRGLTADECAAKAEGGW